MYLGFLVADGGGLFTASVPSGALLLVQCHHDANEAVLQVLQFLSIFRSTYQ